MRSVCRPVKAHFAEYMSFYTKQLLICIDKPEIPKDFKLVHIDSKKDYGVELYYSHVDTAVRLQLPRTKYITGLIVELVVYED